MKTNRLLRVLSLLSFLLLMAPFYDSCNGERMHRIADAKAEPTIDTTVVQIDSVQIDSTQIETIEVDTTNSFIENYEISFLDKAYQFVDDEDSENAFEFAQVSIDNILEFKLTEIKKGIREEGYGFVFFEIKNFCFILIIITTLLILISSFKNNRWVHKLSRLNLILLLITVICLFSEGLFENISQIKWGYYAFIITNLFIFYYSKPRKVPT
jgi:hypothetical protein